MPSLIVSVGSADERPVALTKERTTLGRRPYNDIVIDHLAVSGEHAVIEMQGQQVYLEDLHSTNGTHVNGKAITRQLLQHNDTIEIGKSKIKYLHAQEFSDTGFDKAMLMQAPLAESAPSHMVAAQPKPGAASNALNGLIKVISGAGAGREMPLVKVVTTIGKPRSTIAAITKRQHGFVLAHIEGEVRPLLNGVPLGTEPVTLRNGDVLELAGTQMQFVQE